MRVCEFKPVENDNNYFTTQMFSINMWIAEYDT